MVGGSFIHGLDLSESFYREAVGPILQEQFPELKHSAACIGSGSEVLGFDTQMSADHHWGPRVMLFVQGKDLETHRLKVAQSLSLSLPLRFKGYPTSFTAPDAEDKGVQLLDYREEGPVNHRVEMLTIAGFFLEYLGVDTKQKLEPADWLSLPEQKLRSITGGRVFRDDLGLEEVRERFAYYPHDVWLYLLASLWTRIEQDEHLMGRAGVVGDEIGSAIIAARLVRDLMRLCFLMERRYAPYPKWFGTAFCELKASERLKPILPEVLSATNWKERERHLTRAYECAAVLHNSLAITEMLPETVSPFFDRPFLVISKGVFSKAISGKITDPCVREIASRRLIGNIDMFSDSTDILSDSCWRETLRQLYAPAR